jgi:hypothetical protein
MFHTSALCTISVRLLLGVLVVCLVVGEISTAHAADDDIVRVEEDWELVVTSTDSNSTSPQVSTAFSPWGNVEGHYATFEINHQSAPTFEDGGLHLQIWNSDDIQDTVCHGTDSVMDTDGETVRWTQRIRVHEGRLYFSVRNGSSTTWGSFGAYGALWRSVPSNLHSLNAYDPEVSVENSGITFGGNRVSSLVLKEVRRYRADGQVLVDDTSRPVHTP